MYASDNRDELHPQPAGAEHALSDSVGDLSGYELLVGVTGGIAAYKTAQLVSRAVQANCGVSVLMTENAQRFIGQLTFRALTERPVITSLWSTDDKADIQHLALTEQADLLLVAPASANCIAKFASGICDDLISTLLIGADCPIVMAPAMNTRMWQHPSTQRNVEFLREAHVEFVGPDSGYLACKTIGPGRMVDPDALLSHVSAQLRSKPPRRAKRD